MTALMHGSLCTDVALLSNTNGSLLANTGKLLRPMICLLVAKALGEPGEDSVRFAAAVELLHNATLMHDDVADASSKRRGVPTVSALLGPDAAVLVGDYWLAAAVKTIFRCGCRDKVADIFSDVLTLLAEGEMLQLEKAESADTDTDDYYRIIRCKTATLFEVAGEAGACSVGASEELVRASREFSSAFGMAFQIKDDILDYAGKDSMGKPSGVDLRERKITLPLLGAMENTGRGEEIRAMLRQIGERQEYVDEIRRFVLEGGGIEYAARRLDGFISKAREALAAFPDSPAREFLSEIAGYNVYREV